MLYPTLPIPRTSSNSRLIRRDSHLVLRLQRWYINFSRFRNLQGKQRCLSLPVKQASMPPINPSSSTTAQTHTCLSPYKRDPIQGSFSPHSHFPRPGFPLINTSSMHNKRRSRISTLLDSIVNKDPCTPAHFTLLNHQDMVIRQLEMEGGGLGGNEVANISRRFREVGDRAVPVRFNSQSPQPWTETYNWPLGSGSSHPSTPRGPPRKPKQSGHALWVGNLPPGTNVVDLKDHFSREATEDIESVFLISKSNCAFVNYKTEATCAAAMARFHDSRFQGVRLVCRLRRSTANANTGIPTGPAALSSPPTGSKAAAAEDETKNEAKDEGPAADATPAKDKFFIVKSLTVEDLELSVQNGIWATQSHNEDALNKAFKVRVSWGIMIRLKTNTYNDRPQRTSTCSSRPTSRENTSATQE